MPRERPKLPTAKAIRDHWSDWCWKRHNDPPDDHYCFACGMTDDRFKLERAHIVARCNGGSDGVENLHLLCHTCHRASEFREGKDYFDWLDEWTMHDRIFLEAAKVGEPMWKRMHETVEQERERAYAEGFEAGKAYARQFA